MQYFQIQALPDEDIGSVLIRTCRLYGLSAASLAQHFLPPRSAYGNVVLFRLIQPVSTLTGLSRGRVLAEHTMLPYGLAGHGAKVQRAVLFATIEGRLPEDEATFGKVTLRWCEVCLRMDVAQYGTPYWHRVHLLPGVTFCVHHGRQLQAVTGQRPNYRRLMQGLVSWTYGQLPGEQAAAVIPLAEPAVVQREFTRQSAATLRPGTRLVIKTMSSVELYKTFSPAYLRYVGCRYPAKGAESVTTLKLLSKVARHLRLAEAHGHQFEFEL